MIPRLRLPPLRIGAAPRRLDAPRAPVALPMSGPVPLSFVASNDAHPDANLGDGLSGFIVSALSGRPFRRLPSVAQGARMTAVGTIGQNLGGGAVVVWGTGFGSTPRDTTRGLRMRLDVRALRGPLSRLHLELEGFEAPTVYGDPVWLMPLLHRKPVTPRWELGVIPHISEFDGDDRDAPIRRAFTRYAIPEDFREAVRLLPTYCDPTAEGLLARIDDIRSCKRILSTSFHGLLIAMAYGVPAAYFATHAVGARMLDALDESWLIDHRFRDWWLGIGRRKLPAYGARRNAPSDWEAAMRAVDEIAIEVDWRGEALVESFPLPIAFDPFGFAGDILETVPLLRTQRY